MQLISVEDRGDARWITLRGELDQQEVLDLKARFDRAVETASGTVVVDLSAVTFIGTLGIGLIISACEGHTKDGKDFKLHSVPVPIEKTFERMSIGDRFERT